MIHEWPPGAQHLLFALDAEPRSRSDLLERADLSESDWRAAIDYLVSRGWCERTGERRWARYTLMQADFAVDDVPEQVILLRAHGHTLREIAEECKVSIHAVRAVLDGRIPDDLVAEDEVGEPEDEASESQPGWAEAQGAPSLAQASESENLGDLLASDPDLVAIHTILDRVPRSRADILQASGVDESRWLPLIRVLVDSGLAVRTGSKRGTRYMAAATAAGEVLLTSREASKARPPEGRHSTPAVTSLNRSLVRSSYHDIVDELLGGILAGDSAVTTSELQSSAPADLVAALTSAGVEVVDHRSRGGCLWVIDGPAARAAMTSIAPRFGARFTRAANSRACGGRAAWWTRAEG